MKLTLPVTLTAAVLAIAAAPSFAGGANCPCSGGAEKASGKAAPKTSVQAVAKKTPTKMNTKGEVPSISHEKLVKAIASKKATVIDVNGTESFKEGRIPTSINYAEVAGNLKSKLPTNKGALVVAYCGNERCGAYKKAAAEAKSLGYTNVVHYSPGIAGWKKSGADVEKG
jgi:rhodanese-related sulfurtransferase